MDLGREVLSPELSQMLRGSREEHEGEGKLKANYSHSITLAWQKSKWLSRPGTWLCRVGIHSDVFFGDMTVQHGLGIGLR